MPYIKKSDREYIDGKISPIAFTCKGDLEYAIFKLMTMYMKSREFKYSELHDVVYAAAHCSDEFRRRFLDVREDQARKQNGDIS
jgi:hypothetical protein